MRVHGTGPHPCHLMFVGEGPGVMESKTGIPFHPAAPAGAELGRYLDGYRLPTRDEIFITNLVKEWEGGSATKKNQQVTAEDILRDEWELREELLAVKPKLVVTLGRHSTRWFLGKDVDMEAVHGVLFHVFIEPHPVTAPGIMAGVYVLPCYHPAAGLHQPELAARTAYDLNQLSIILQGEDMDKLVWKENLSPTKIISPLEMGKAVTGEYGVDTEGTPESPWCVSLSARAGEACVIRTPFLLAGPVPVTGSIFHNYMWDVKVLEALGIVVDDDEFHDTQVMAYLLGVEPQALKALALRHLGMKLPEYTDVVGHWEQQFTKTGKPKKKQTWILGTLDSIAPGKAIQYAGGDADATGQLKPVLWKKIQAAGLVQVYEMDRQCLPVYSRMEQVGMPISMDHMTEFAKDLADELEMRTFCLQLDYPDLNPGSPDQVADIMFNHLQIPGGKKTPSGKRFSTNDKILQALKNTHPFVQAIIDWREIAKLKTTFVDSLPEYCRLAADGSGLRLHAHLLPTRVVSGRLAAKDPNVLALPKHSPLGKRFRRGFRAAPGRLLGSWDLNQVELRVLALDSHSPTMRDTFRAGIDIHSRTGEKIFGVPPCDQDESLHRLPSKTTNFSIAMGTTGIGLAEQQRKNHYPFPELKGVVFASQQKRYEAQAEVCQAWVDEVIKDWGIGPYIAEKHAEARRYGYVRDRWGRMRFLPSVLSPNKQIREGALREAQAFGPQAGARGFYKQILVRVWREVIKPLKAEGYYIEPILDIHDDLLLEFDAHMKDWLVPVVDSIFNGTFGGLEVPITAKSKVGEYWS